MSDLVGPGSHFTGHKTHTEPVVPLTFSDYPRLKEYGARVELPADPAKLHRLALEVISSQGVPCYLTPYGAVRSVASFAIGQRDDPFFNDGEVLLKAAVRASEEAA